jgi:uncharacterized membrane protein HdeD (DUF308 family)
MSFSEDALPGLGYARTAALARNWWALALRGALAFLFGILAVLWPGITLAVLILLYAVYAIADGVTAIIAAVWAMAHHERWGMLIVEGLVGIGAGIIALIWPGLTLLALAWLLAAWAVLTGALMLSAAFRLRHGGWLLGLSGTVSIVWGVLLAIFPIVGAFVLAVWIGVYALFFGGAMIALAFRLRALAQKTEKPA